MFSENSKRRSYTAKFKLHAIGLAKVNGNRCTARELNVDEKRIREWRKQEEVLLKMPKLKRAQRRGPKAQWPDLEKELCEWIENQRKNGRSLSTVLIRIKANQMAVAKGLNDFRGGPSWCNRFFRRNKLTMRARTTVGQKLPDDWEKKKELFLKFVKEEVKKYALKPSEVGNMDEVPISFDMPASRSADFVGVKSVPIVTTGNEKNGFTVVLSCLSSGYKLPPMVIFKRKTIPKENFPKGIVVLANEKGWMNQDVMKEWAEKCWRKRPNFIFQKNSLLIMDSMRAHLTDETKKTLSKEKTRLAIVPGGLTKIVQPLDLSINRSFKANMRHCWESWMSEENHTFTKGGRMRKATNSEVCEWILKSWDKIPKDMVEKAFFKAEITEFQQNSTDGFDSHSDDDDESSSDTDEHLPPEVLELFHTDTEDDDFDGFSDTEN